MDSGAKLFYTKIGSVFRERRIQLGLSQADVASKIGLTRASIANIETGRQAMLLHSYVLLVNTLYPKKAIRFPIPVTASQIGKRGGTARAKALTKKERILIASKAGKARWAKRETVQ